MDPSNPATKSPADVPPTEHVEEPTVHDAFLASSDACPETNAPNSNTPQQKFNVDPEAVINRIRSEFLLNKKQWVAFCIIARSFIKTYVQMGDTPEAICMLLTGPGGTGKTHVVNALRALMVEYGDKHTLQFLAPTGSVASLIDGMTIHKGLGIKIKSNKKGKGNRDPGQSAEDYTVLITIRNRTLLRDEWQLVKVLFIDEVSLLSQQLISEVDHALR